MIGPRHLFGAAQFHALNLIDVGSHLAGNEIITELRTGKFANIAERAGRAQDKDDGGGLETLRRDGHM